MAVRAAWGYLIGPLAAVGVVVGGSPPAWVEVVALSAAMAVLWWLAEWLVGVSGRGWWRSVLRFVGGVLAGRLAVSGSDDGSGADG